MNTPIHPLDPTNLQAVSDLHAMRKNANRYIAIRDAFVKEMNADGVPVTAELFDRQADHHVAGTDPKEDFELQQMMHAVADAE